jgi:Protein of unknown function (DUF3667)
MQMSLNHKKAHTPYCLNCHYPVAEFDSFCPNCGQKNTDGKTSMHDLWHEFVHSWVHVDGKIFNTLFALFNPGKLTEQFFKADINASYTPFNYFLLLEDSIFFSRLFQQNPLPKP